MAIPQINPIYSIQIETSEAAPHYRHALIISQGNSG